MKRRTHTCGELRKTDVNKTVHLQGWVARARDLGGLIFIDLRDRYGKTQVVVHPEENPALAELAHSLHAEWVIEIDGMVESRPANMINANMPTGEIEVHCTAVNILNRCPVLPFQIEDAATASEELRLKYRFLDLRRPELQEIFVLRHKISNVVREHFTGEGFLEIETPYMVKSTPEGARDYLVPSRIFPNQFYALPQSPQIYKQILMVAGMDKYFQLVRCFRDEDLRSDRQPEFTQVDVEMSFIDRDQIFETAERLFQKILKAGWNTELAVPFPRLTYDHVMETYGSDKPDLRFGLPFSNLTKFVQQTEFRVIAEALKANGEVIGLNLAGQAELSRKQITELEELARSCGLDGISSLKVTAEGFAGVLVGKTAEENLKAIAAEVKAKAGDLILMAIGKKSKILKGLGVFRQKLAEKFKLYDPNECTRIHRSFGWWIFRCLSAMKRPEKSRPLTMLLPVLILKMSICWIPSRGMRVPSVMTW